MCHEARPDANISHSDSAVLVLEIGALWHPAWQGVFAAQNQCLTCAAGPVRS